ncbi:transcription factor PAP1-domain-containing protein [Dipodascopsis tothii]|uniref:transcription factor PAP1-domain-containing protein n=1 Tax=Dipodascopsis tothii TaxID=44089 RepID=UPI0034CDA8F7
MDRATDYACVLPTTELNLPPASICSINGNRTTHHPSTEPPHDQLSGTSQRPQAHPLDSEQQSDGARPEVPQISQRAPPGKNRRPAPADAPRTPNNRSPPARTMSELPNGLFQEDPQNFFAALSQPDFMADFGQDPINFSLDQQAAHGFVQPAALTAGRDHIGTGSSESSPHMSSTNVSPQFLATDHEKRKLDDNLSDEDLSDDGATTSHKRKDTSADPEDAKKRPGRKLMTAEPANKRKAQNRAAQRAFRERKEKHLRDLEARVAELENDAHTMSTENQFLKKQVDRLQSELKEYRKRQTMGGTKASTPSAMASPNNQSAFGNSPFTFEFPLFGGEAKTGSPQMGNAPSLSAGTTTSAGTSSGAPTPGSVSGKSMAKSPNMGSPFSPNMHFGGGVMGFPSRGSPGATVKSPGANGMPSPALAAAAAAAGAKPNQSQISSTCKARNLYDPNPEEDDFCAKLSMACGTQDNPIPKAHAATPGAGPMLNMLSPLSFDSDLFSEYRDPVFNNASSTGLGSLGMGVGMGPDDEFTLPELTPDDVFDEVTGDVGGSSAAADASDGKDEVVPADNKPLMGCTALWDRISMHPKFGDLDIDGLCTELRTKAKCSESGVVVTEADLNAVLRKIEAAN